MPELKGISYLKRKLNLKRNRVRMRYRYYEMKNIVRDLGISTPPNLKELNSVLGWCAKSVDSLADRLIFSEFRNDNFNINEIFQMNNPDTFFDSVNLSALIGSCCFVYISPDKEGYPRLQVIDGGNATGIINPITGLLYEGYAVLERDDSSNPALEAYFEPYKTTYFRKGKAEEVTIHEVEYPLLVPIIHRPDAVRAFGRSRISRACISLVQSATRTIKRSEIAAEFYSFPQKYVVGTDPEGERIDKWKATMSTMIELTKDEEGDAPSFGQFTQQSMSPHTDQLKMFASAFAGETGLTMDDLGFSTENPSSAEAIKASHETLMLMARKAQRNFGSGLLNVGYLAACLRDDFQYKRQQFYLTKAEWEPIFEPDAAMLSSIGDGAIKINQAIPGYLDKNTMKQLTGITASQGAE